LRSDQDSGFGAFIDAFVIDRIACENREYDEKEQREYFNVDAWAHDRSLKKTAF
jgi:hypothetical protein